MTISKSLDQIFVNVIDRYKKDPSKEKFVILVGGCSRSGKSTLTEYLEKELTKFGIQTHSINMDSWLISVDERPANSTVSQRYELLEIRNAVEKLLRGEAINTPIYDPVKRKRVKDRFKDPFHISSGILIIDGVIALADEVLLQKSDMRIYVSIPDCLRIKRLLSFYKEVKKIDRNEYKKIIRAREGEETLFVKKSSLNADFVFCWP